MNWLLYVIFGFLAGVAAGMGMGGGTVMIPALTLLCAMPQHDAQGVNMLAFLPAAVVALIVHNRAGRLDVKECMSVIISGAVAAAAGAFLASMLAAPWLRRGFGIFLLLIAAVQFVKGERDSRK
ncbi:MAG: sulfite exporter TauE/SafE family protein [Clostridia bacterium]